MTTRDTFNALVGELDYPMFIVTAAAGGEPSGCLVGFATQASIGPGRFLVCLSDKNHTFGVAARATHLGVHFVPADREDLADLVRDVVVDQVAVLLGRDPEEIDPTG